MKNKSKVSIMQPTYNSTSVLVKTASKHFINAVTDFHGNYEVTNQKQQRSIYTKSRSSSSGKVNSGTFPVIANFLKVYYDFSYFLLLCPFKIVPNEKRIFVIKKCRPQTVLCAVMNFMCFIHLVTEIRMSVEKMYRYENANKNPVRYFSIALATAGFFYKMITMKRFWLNQKDCLNVLTHIQGTSFLEGSLLSGKVFNAVYILRIFFFLTSLHCFVCFVLGKYFISPNQSWRASLWFSQLIKYTRYTFFFDKSFIIDDITPPSITTTMDIFFAIIMSIIFIARHIFGLFSDLFILFNVITLWSAAKTFSTSVLTNMQGIMKRERNQSEMAVEEPQYRGSHIAVADVDHHKDYGEDKAFVWSDVYERFRIMQTLAMKINIVLGGLLTWYMAGSVMYYSIHLSMFVTSKGVLAGIDLAIFYFTTVGILLISADICSQMEHVKVWISFGENSKNIPPDEFSIVLHEMLAKDVGIKGSNVFTVTYSLLAGIVSTSVTYFIICIQQDENSVSVQQVSNGTMYL